MNQKLFFEQNDGPVCADQSQYLHERNRINSLIINYSGFFFGGHLNTFLLFGSFLCLKTLFLDFHLEKLSCSEDIQMIYCKKKLIIFLKIVKIYQN